MEKQKLPQNLLVNFTSPVVPLWLYSGDGKTLNTLRPNAYDMVIEVKDLVTGQSFENKVIIFLNPDPNYNPDQSESIVMQLFDYFPEGWCFLGGHFLCNLIVEGVQVYPSISYLSGEYKDFSKHLLVMIEGYYNEHLKNYSSLISTDNSTGLFAKNVEPNLIAERISVFGLYGYKM